MWAWFKGGAADSEAAAGTPQQQVGNHVGGRSGQGPRSNSHGPQPGSTVEAHGPQGRRSGGAATRRLPPLLAPRCCGQTQHPHPSSLLASRVFALLCRPALGCTSTWRGGRAATGRKFPPMPPPPCTTQTRTATTRRPSGTSRWRARRCGVPAGGQLLGPWAGRAAGMQHSSSSRADSCCATVAAGQIPLRP
jgi:hypothetical protein